MADETRRTPEPGGHEEFDREIGVRGIVGFAIGLTAVLLITSLGLWGLFRALESEERAREEPPSPLLAEAGAPAPPEPRLQTSPESDLAAMRAAEDSLLHGYGWADERARLVRIPIERAMELLLTRGLPVRATPLPWTPPGTWSDPSLERLAPRASPLGAAPAIADSGSSLPGEGSVRGKESVGGADDRTGSSR